MNVQLAPVPEPTEQEDGENISHPKRARYSVSAQGSVEVIPKPGGERDMPAPPEICHRIREIGTPEIGHQVVAHDASCTDGHIRVAREVAINLNGKENCCENQEGCRVAARTRVDRVDNHGQAVGDDHFLDQTPEDELKPLNDSLGLEMRFAAELRKQTMAALDGPGHQLREEGDVEREDAQMALSRSVAPIDIDRVSDGLEGVEGDAKRQQEIKRGHGVKDVDRFQGLLDIAGEKIEVFEGEEDSETR